MRISYSTVATIPAPASILDAISPYSYASGEGMECVSIENLEDAVLSEEVQDIALPFLKEVIDKLKKTGKEIGEVHFVC